MLEIAELFYSLQGESTWAGRPCTFVRLSRCNLRCSYCDASYTYHEEGTRLSVTEILERVIDFGCPLVELTGGEPLLQDETQQLCTALIRNGYQVLMETNGSLPVDCVPLEVCLIVDVKCPDSGMADSFAKTNIDIIRNRRHLVRYPDEIKFVLSSADDYLFAKDFIRSYELHTFSQVLLSPVASRFSPADCAEMILADHLDVRLQLQLHKQLWPEATRGK